MTIRLFQRRSVWWPTLTGWIFFLFGLGIPITIWCYKGEKFLSRTERRSADVLVVEGWIGTVGIRAAKAEFERGGYHRIIATGGMSGNRWDDRQWSFAIEAEELLLRLGLNRDQVVIAKPQDVENHRTFASAVAVRRILQAKNIHAKDVTLFTFGVHARRSRLVYAKVLQPESKVGVISWIPNGYNEGPWWESSDRSLDLLKETVGFCFEAMLNSGRSSNTPTQDTP